jgi:hypothetical protein
MKRQAKRIRVSLTAEKQAEQKKVRETIDHEEKAELIASARRIRKEHATTPAALRRTDS